MFYICLMKEVVGCKKKTPVREAIRNRFGPMLDC